MTLLLALVLAPPAIADDIDLGDIEIDLDDIDLGSSGHGDESSTYTGGLTERKNDLGDNVPVTVTHYGGNITVRCTEGDQISARIDFSVEGTDRDRLKAYGDGIGLAVWGDANGAGAKTRMPSKSSAIQRADVPLMVSAPPGTRLTVQGRDGWVQITNCTGALKASSTAGGVFAEGRYDSFQVTSQDGDVKVELTGNSVINASSAATSTKGKVELILPDDANVKLAATGAEVRVEHLVSGTNTDTNVSGNIGNGGPSVRLSAPKGEVKVKTP
ncbi:MAG: DUF4097 family beta strand repeat protein [Alphaproteobacteria bacterium]|nr:DUF4097 family beta strand repeat protein [Alphaproteobacteria bacterium]